MYEIPYRWIGSLLPATRYWTHNKFVHYFVHTQGWVHTDYTHPKDAPNNIYTWKVSPNSPYKIILLIEIIMNFIERTKELLPRDKVPKYRVLTKRQLNTLFIIKTLTLFLDLTFLSLGSWSWWSAYLRWLPWQSSRRSRLTMASRITHPSFQHYKRGSSLNRMIYRAPPIWRWLAAGQRSVNKLGERLT